MPVKLVIISLLFGPEILMMETAHGGAPVHEIYIHIYY